MALSRLGGMSYIFKILIIFPRWIESKAFLNSIKVTTAERLFFRASSSIRCITSIWLAVVLVSLNQCLPFDVRDRARAPESNPRSAKNRAPSQKITCLKMAVEEFSIIAVCQFA